MPEPASATVRELKAQSGATGQPFASLLVVRKLATKMASNGNPFLSVDLGDRTGVFSCTVFSDNAAFEGLKSAGEGAVVRVEGKIEQYQGRLSPRLAKVAAVTEAELARPGLIDHLVEITPEDPAGLERELAAFIEGIGHPGLQVTVRNALEDLGGTFQTAPAASMMHHAYRHGLLEHTVRMARAAKALAPLYPEVNGDLAMAGILLHDSGKALEFEGTLAPKRTRRGLLQGHVVLGYQLVRKAGLKAKLDPEHLERLEHVILSHQGQLEWGAAVLAATPEAVFVSMIDNLDARMGMVQRAVRQAADGEEFSERIPGLDTQLLTRPPDKAS
ncbi:MAG TPA: HD domain-containing protein [Opitutaceae bacterium]|jgi:3'-5' exoribonuclease|nr:HD domain-containing protein [Opitutaceae bacterium]